MSVASSSYLHIGKTILQVKKEFESERADADFSVTEAYMWIWDNRNSSKRGTLTWKLLMVMNVVFIILGMFGTVAGTYSAAVTINTNMKSGNTAK